MARDLALESCWRDRIQECRQSELSIKAWCLQQGLNTSAYYYWVRRLKALDQHETTGYPFAEVILLPESKHTPQEPPPSTAQLSLSVGSYSINIPNGFDPATLVEIVKVLQKL